jgi:fibronectin-binding autotransporter adhesin
VGCFAAALVTLVGSWTVTPVRANTEKDVNTNASADLSNGTNYTPSGTPAPTNDTTFKSATYTTTTFTLPSGGSLNTGTLDDLDATQSLTITHVTGGMSDATLTLNGGTDSVTGSGAADLIFLAPSANLTIQNAGKNLNVVLASSGNFDVGSSASLTVSSAISGTGGFTKTGTGIATLGGTGANIYSGLTTVSAGELDLGKMANVNAIGSGGLTISGGTVKYTGTSPDEIANTANVTISGGTLDLNNHTDTIASLTFNSGTLTSTGGTQTLTLAGSTATTLQMQGAATIPTSVNIAFSSTTTSGVGMTFDATNNGTATINGNINLNSAGTAGVTRTFTINDGTAAIDTTISGVISDTTNSAALTKAGTGTLILSGANTYGGGTTINAGIVRMSGSGTLGDSAGTLTMNGGTLDLNGINQNVGALNGSGGTILNEAPSGGGGPKTLTVGNGNTSGSFSGTITDHDGSGSGFVKLVKTGTGTQTMSSTTSNYTGGTDINGGVLISNSSNGGALGRGAINVNNTGTLAGSGTIDPAASITVNSGGTLMPGSTASAGSIAKLNTGSVTLAAGSTFAVDLNAGAGPTGAGAGTIYDQVSVTGTITLAGMLTVNPGAGLAIGDKFLIMLNDGSDAVSGGFSNAPTTGSTFTSGSDVFLIDYVDNGDGSLIPNDISLTVTAIPEPGTWVAAALTLLTVGYTQRKRFTPSLKKSVAG